MRFALAFLLACAVVRADTLSELKQRLGSLDDSGRVIATVTYESQRIQKEAEPAKARKRTVVGTDGPEGFQMRWPRPAAETDSAAATEAEHKAWEERRDGIGGLSPAQLFSYLNIAGELTKVLSQAELTGEKAEVWKGQPARRISLKLTPPLSEKDRKYIKELTAQATVWLDQDGWPLAAERQLHVKGRALLVISFEQNETESFEFARVAGRLVAVRHEKSSQGSGGGESGGEKILATLAVSES